MMRRIPILTMLPLLLFAGLAGLFFMGMLRDDPDGLPSTREGLAAPPITQVAIADLPTFSNDSLRAPGVKIVNFWASWCAPCRAEHPNLIALSNDLPVYGVNRDRRDEDAMRFLNDLGNPFAAVVADEKNRQSIDWGVYALPETFVIDGSGQVVLHFRGPITQRSLARDLLPAIEKARANSP